MLREVEVDSVLDIKTGDIFRMEPVDEQDTFVEAGDWWRATKDGEQKDEGSEPSVRCAPMPLYINQTLKKAKLQ